MKSKKKQAQEILNDPKKRKIAIKGAISMNKWSLALYLMLNEYWQ